MPEGDFHQRCSEVIQSSSLSEETVLAVVLETLLLGDMQLLSSIRKPASSVVSIQMEEESRNHTNTLLIGKTMLNRNSYDGGLSQDLQLCLLLESFGGTSYESSTGLLGSSRRHEKQIDRWVGERPRKAIYTSDRYEPVAVPLVRALCAFAGGIGAALSEEIAEPKTSETRNNLDRSSFVSWALPPAAIACSEWAIVAAGRCVLHSIASSKQTDWRCSHLSMFVVVVLHSAYALHSGIESFALHQFRRPVAELPHLMGVINACDAVASTLLENIQEMDGDRRLDLDLNNSKFLEWYNRIQMTISSRSEMTPVSERKNIVS